MIKSFPGLLAAAVLLMLSCNDRPSSPLPPTDNKSGKMNFAFLRYDSAAVEYRLDSLHNRGLILQFTLDDVGNNNSAFRLISYAFDTMGDLNNSWMPDSLAIVTDSIPKTFDGKMALGNHEITRAQLYDVLRDKNGNRFSYDYLLFAPVVEGVFNHVVYTFYPVKGNAPAVGGKVKMQMTTPMPPQRVW